MEERIIKLREMLTELRNWTILFIVPVGIVDKSKLDIIEGHLLYQAMEAITDLGKFYKENN